MGVGSAPAVGFRGAVSVTVLFSRPELVALVDNVVSIRKPVSPIVHLNPMEPVHSAVATGQAPPVFVERGVIVVPARIVDVIGHFRHCRTR